MNKRKFIGLASAGVVLLGIAGNSGSTPQASNSNVIKQNDPVHSVTADTQAAPKVTPVCDGTTVTTNCAIDGVNYSTYISHPAVPEKSHVETVTTYEKKITGYCTLCNDGTYSPSCATGRGACSWHGGVQQWNAPEYTNAPVTSTKTVIDAPAQAAYYEKVPV